MKETASLIVTGYFDQNFGDDLMLSALLIHLRKTPVHVTLLAEGHVDSYKVLFPNIKVIKKNAPLRLMWAWLRRHLGSKSYSIDCLVKNNPVVYLIGSGFSFSGEPNKHEGDPLPRLMRRNPFFVIGANFGPYDNSKKRLEIYQEAFSFCKDVCFRESYSKSLFPNVPNVRWTTDISFSLFPTLEKLNASKEKMIVVAPANTGYLLDPQVSLNYCKQIASYCEAFQKQGYTISLIAMNIREQDDLLCQKIKNFLQGKTVIILYDQSLEQIERIFKKAEVVIATRYHAMILGLMSRCKVLPLPYSDKSIHVLRDIGFTQEFSMANKLPHSLPPLIHLDSKQLEELADVADKSFVKLDEYLSE